MNMQLDNQMFDCEDDIESASTTNGPQNQQQNQPPQLKYDFPVIFLPRSEFKCPLSWPRFTRSVDQMRRVGSFTAEPMCLSVRLVLAEQEQQLQIPTSLEIEPAPFDLYLEDYLLYNLIQIFVDYVDHLTAVASPAKPAVSLTAAEDDAVEELAQLVRPTLLVHRFRIEQVDALVNLQTKLKIFLATYKMPVRFERFEVAGLPFRQLTTRHFVKLLTGHYLTALVFRVGWLLGSLDLIGSPAAFVQQASSGLYDFVLMPYRGMRSGGAQGLLGGLTSGSLSLVRNMSSGSITSLTAFAAFVSRNMDLLSCDQNHLVRQDQLRHELSSLSTVGHSPNFLLNASASFVITIMGAIGGLAEQPMHSLVNSESLIKGDYIFFILNANIIKKYN
jgi:vacuolar protein sorting-associated protein 13B